MVFSITAPTVSAEQEASERAAFSSQELDQIQRDVFGPSADDDDEFAGKEFSSEELELVQEAVFFIWNV